MRKARKEGELRIRPRETETVALRIPTDVLKALQKVAAGRDMSVEALMKLYIGGGLRQDLAKLFSEHVLEMTEQVLAKHLPSAHEVSAIMREIQSEALPAVNDT
jgi:hypothetical protein